MINLNFGRKAKQSHYVINGSGIDLVGNGIRGIEVSIRGPAGKALGGWSVIVDVRGVGTFRKTGLGSQPEAEAWAHMAADALVRLR